MFLKLAVMWIFGFVIAWLFVMEIVFIHIYLEMFIHMYIVGSPAGGLIHFS